MEIQATNVFRRTHEAIFKDGYSGVLSEGGSRSSKTKSNCQLIVWYCLTHTGKVVTLGRDWRTNFKKTVWLDVQWALRSFRADYKLNSTEMTIEINGNLIRCIGTNDDPMLTYGLEQDVFWLNEANAIPKDAFDQLEQRTSEFWIVDYNPKDSDHWLYNLELRKDVKLIKSTILDNPFAPEKSRKKILSYNPDVSENVAKKTADPYKWTVFGLGQRGASDDIIFKSFNIYSDAEEPKASDCDLFVFGGDFGFASPSAMVQIKKKGVNLYLKQVLYKAGLTNQQIAHEIDAYKDEISVWDSSEMKSIQELRLAGVNAYPAVKGDGSIYFGLQLMRNYNLFLHADSADLIRELKTAKFTTDVGGNIVKDSKGRPIHLNTNEFHGLACVRYGLTKFLTANEYSSED